MSVAKVIEISSESKKSFEDAITKGVKRASSTLEQVKSAWIKEQSVTCENGKVTAYRVSMLVTFILAEPTKRPGGKRT